VVTPELGRQRHGANGPVLLRHLLSSAHRSEKSPLSDGVCTLGLHREAGCVPPHADDVSLLVATYQEDADGAQTTRLRNVVDRECTLVLLAIPDGHGLRVEVRVLLANVLLVELPLLLAAQVGQLRLLGLGPRVGDFVDDREALGFVDEAEAAVSGTDDALTNDVVRVNRNG